LEKISINTAGHNSDILTGESWLNVMNYIPGNNVVIITDENLLGIYGHEFPPFPVVPVTPGEGSKTLHKIEELAYRLLELGIDRSGFILGIGGGVVCDIAGFLASVYMRGIRFGFVSTSLLSQVDASVGGKNGVNLGIVKNIIGSFNQPDFVICDPTMLLTLPEDEFLSGLAELIKMGAIMDSSLLREIEGKHSAVMKRDVPLMGSLVKRSVILKAEVVNEDEKEAGRRMILNFGHTFGHVIETNANQKHGFAVASGMVVAAGISMNEGLLSAEELKYLTSILGSFNLLKKFSIASEVFMEMIATDKKKAGKDISFVLLDKIGKAMIRKMSISRLAGSYDLIRHLL
jgi:3-dehydroquinate synthase